MRYLVLAYGSLQLISCVCSLFFSPVVEIEQGRLRGIRASSGINKYYGIPYATSERFYPPREPRNWDGVFNAINPLTVCAQINSYISTYEEDCLQLDVYTPENSKPGDKFPVFVFIHGGAYFFGSKLIYNPEFLVTKNIVAVTINYRLGVLGFLCVNGVANLGLKDQTAALKWVKKNIAAFGGDPDHVILAGQSAGAISTTLHMLSENSAGLFHKAILLSGFMLSPWAFNVEPMRPALMDANKIGEANTEEEIYRVFAKASTRQLLGATRGEFYDTRYFKYSPCLDNNMTDPFFRDTPLEIIKSGNFNKVPIMIGVTDKEGIVFYGTNNKTTFAGWNIDFVNRLPSVFSWCSKEDRERIAKKVRDYYFGNQIINEGSVKSFVRYYSDWLVHSTFDDVSQLLAKYSGEPVYKYVFSYQGGRNFLKTFLGRAGIGIKGAAHGDDLFYIFKPFGLPWPISVKDQLFIDRITSMLTNFIKYTDPTPKRSDLLPVHWPASTSDKSYIMHLDHTLKVTRGPWHKDRFFLNLLCTYGLKGYVPCESQQQYILEDRSNWHHD